MKKTISLLLALAVCLGLGTFVSAAAEEPTLPSLEAYLGPCENYEEGAADNSEYGLDDFLWASATVPLTDIDRALGYMALLEEGPFHLELAQCVTLLKDGAQREEDSCEELAYGPDANGFAAAFDLTGGGDPGLIPGAMAPVGGGRAVGVLVQPDEDAGMADIQLFCAAGFRFTEQWEEASGEEPALPDPAAWLGDMAKEVEIGKDASQRELVTCRLAEGAANAVMGYLDLLLDARFHLEFTGKITTNWGTMKNYGYRYTGGSDAVSTDESLVSVRYGLGKLELHYPSGFVLTDGGDRFDPSVSYEEPEGYDANAAAIEAAAVAFGQLDATPAPTTAPAPAPASD